MQNDKIIDRLTCKYLEEWTRRPLESPPPYSLLKQHHEASHKGWKLKEKYVNFTLTGREIFDQYFIFNTALLFSSTGYNILTLLFTSDIVPNSF